MIMHMCLFFFNDTATTEIYTLSLHDALPISALQPGPEPDRTGLLQAQGLLAVRDGAHHQGAVGGRGPPARPFSTSRVRPDRKSTRLNSSHANISYAVFCLKKKKTVTITNIEE